MTNFKYPALKRLTPIVALASAIALLAGGCATANNTKNAGDASTSLHEAALSVAKSNAQLDTVLIALSDLVNRPGENMRGQFETYSANVSKLDALANEVTGHANAMHAEGAAYFARWDEDLAKINNEDLRTRSVDRKAVVSARFDQVKASYAQTRTDFAPFVSDLKDIRTMLGTDLTEGGLASVRNLAKKADRDVVPLRTSLDRLESDFESLGLSLSASTPVK